MVDKYKKKLHKGARKFWKEQNLRIDNNFKGKKYYTPGQRKMFIVIVVLIIIRLLIALKGA